MPMLTPKEVLSQTRVIAVVGLSTNSQKDSHRVAAFLQNEGYHIVPVHPTADSLLGERVFRSLEDIPIKVDLVNVFRPVSEAPDWARAAVAIEARSFWLQLGLESSEAASIVGSAGLNMVQNRCTAIEQRALRTKNAGAPSGEE